MQGILAGNFAARDPLREIFQSFLGKHLFLRVRNKLLSNNAPASKLLTKNSSFGRKFPLESFRKKVFVRKLPAKESFLWENCYVRALLRGKHLVRILVPGSCRIIQILPGRSFLMRQSLHRKTKQKTNIHNPK
jgi:hypothetical protein